MRLKRLSRKLPILCLVVMGVFGAVLWPEDRADPKPKAFEFISLPEVDEVTELDDTPTTGELLPQLLRADPVLRASSPEIIEVTATQLLDEPEKYSLRLVRVSGYWTRGFETSFISQSLSPKGNVIWFETLLIPFTNARDLKRQADQALLERRIPEARRRDARIFVTIEGLFEHSASRSVSSPGFGHLDRFNSQLSLTKIITIRASLPEG